MTRQHLAAIVAAALLTATPAAVVSLVPAAHLLDAADLIIAMMDAAEVPFEDLEPEEDDDSLLEASVQPVLLCPDVIPPRRLRGGRT